jgi:hypothetical protein
MSPTASIVELAEIVFTVVEAVTVILDTLIVLSEIFPLSKTLSSVNPPS